MGCHFNLSASLLLFSCSIHWRMKNVLPHPQAPRNMMAYCGSGISAYSFKKVSMFLFITMFIRGFKVTEKSRNVWRIIDCYRRFIRLLCAFLLWIFKFQTLSIQCNRITKGNPELLFFRKSDGFAIIQSYIAV